MPNRPDQQSDDRVVGPIDRYDAPTAIEVYFQHTTDESWDLADAEVEP